MHLKLDPPSFTRARSAATVRSRCQSAGSGVGQQEEVFVQVEMLKPRDVFGLQSMSFEQEYEEKRTSVSLISNGAECVLLSKKFFMEHANTLVQCRFRRHVRPYPADETLQENLQNNVDWIEYKQKLVQVRAGQRMLKLGAA